jgi:NTE family protein
LYIKPIRINGTLIFDGGLYNNFPSDVIDREFNPDIILGSNVVGGNTRPPSDDDVISHIKNMVMSRTNYNPICENMIIVSPRINITTFDFSNNEESIRIGYEATQEKIDSIKFFVRRKENPDSLKAKRELFKAKQKPLIFNNIHITGLKKSQENYVRKILTNNKDTLIYSDDFTYHYFRLLADEKIKTIYPVAILDENTDKFELFLDTKADQSLEVQFGGNFSSRPINMAYIGLKYKRLWNTALSVSANSYFGRLYSSVYLNGRMDFPSQTPYFADIEYVRNRFDYFSSNTSFFELVRPPFVIMLENYVRANIGLPAGNQSKVMLSTTFGNMNNDYYQGDNFSVSDTLDRTGFTFFSTRIYYELNNLDRKQFPTEGTLLRLSTTLYSGSENHKPGSTSFTKELFQRNREWITFKAEWVRFFLRKRRYNIGFSGEFVYSTMPFFNNFYATSIMASFYEPIPESRTLFMPNYRANEYTAAGISLIYFLKKNIDIRTEAYLFQPWRTLNVNETNNTTFYGEWFAERSFIGSASLVYNSPVGPASISLNYYSSHSRNWSFLFNFGYLIFNKRAL